MPLYNKVYIIYFNQHKSHDIIASRNRIWISIVNTKQVIFPSKYHYIIVYIIYFNQHKPHEIAGMARLWTPFVNTKLVIFHSKCHYTMNRENIYHLFWPAQITWYCCYIGIECELHLYTLNKSYFLWKSAMQYNKYIIYLITINHHDFDARNRES